MLILDLEELQKISDCIEKNLIKAANASGVLLVDMGGNVIVDVGFENIDVASLAALSAANFAAMSEIAKLVGETEFSLLFHKGKQENIYFTKMSRSFILVTVFGNDISLGLMRLKVSDVKRGIEEEIASGKLKEIF
ncbi:MAG: roadblock/LC7 domain-containing protein [Deltaproteobacteria bacterium]|nr:roadblock/LC7 domain-containing protein [Deltaproteobacteria bacterium]